MRTLTVVGSVLLFTLLAAAPRALATIAAELVAPAAQPLVVNTTLTLHPGSTIDLGGRALTFGAAARITVGAGTVDILAGPVRLLPGARIMGSAGFVGSTLSITSTGAISLEAVGDTRSRIDLSAVLITGSVTLQAASDVTVAGDIISDGRDDEADGGFILLDSDQGKVLVTGSLSAKGGSLSSGGSVLVFAGTTIDLTEIVNVSGGDFGGGDVTIVGNSDVIVRKDVLAGGGGFSGDGGSLEIDAGGTATMLGMFEGDAAGDSDEGGGTGGDVEINADGDIVVSGQMVLNGAFPDGEGGTFFVQSGGSFTGTATVQLVGNGIDRSEEHTSELQSLRHL